MKPTLFAFASAAALILAAAPATAGPAAPDQVTDHSAKLTANLARFGLNTRL